MASVGPIRDVDCEQVLPTVNVGDVDRAVDYYRDVLGFEELWRWGEPAAHAGVGFGTVEIHLASKPPRPGGGWIYFVVGDVDALHAQLVERGAHVRHPPEDQPWGMREIAVRDLVGNDLTFGTQTLVREPALPVDRDAVDVRIERRLLALVRDLADAKGMTLGEMLEETLLHSFEEVEGGVASPHTRRQLDLVRTLKERHGIDYDTHASYRFVERGRGGDSPVG